MSPFYWILAIILAGVWYLWYKGKLKNFRGFKLPSFSSLSLPSFLQPDADTVVERLQKQTAREAEKKAELEKVLTAKRKLAALKAENRQLKRDIDRAEAGVAKYEDDGAEEQKKEKKSKGVRAITPNRSKT